jgi:hypothetical protein
LDRTSETASAKTCYQYKIKKQALQELIDQLLNKVDKPVKKLSNRARKAIAKKQRNTTQVNKKGIVSLIKK